MPISRARCGSVATTSRAARLQIPTPTGTEPATNSIRPRSRSRSARTTGSVTPARAVLARRIARGSCAASHALVAAARSLLLRAFSSLVSSAARSNAALAASKPPRAAARRAASSSAGDDLVVGFVDRGGEVPGPPVGVLTAGHHLGQRPVRLLADVRGRALIDGGADKRVTETDLGPGDGQQPGFLGLGQRTGADTEQVRGLPDHTHPGRIVGGGDTQQGLGVGGQPPAAVQEDPLHALGQRQVRAATAPDRRAGPA